jgi:hypothetical protein
MNVRRADHEPCPCIAVRTSGLRHQDGLHFLNRHAKAKSMQWWHALLQQSNCLEPIIGLWIPPFAIRMRSLQYRFAISEAFAT